MIPRLFVDAALNEGALVALDDAQRHYLRSVLRRAVGDGVSVFNPRDGEYAADLDVLDKKNAIVRLGAQARAPEPAGGSRVVLAFAPVKRGALEMIIQKGVELGAASFQPVRTARVNAEKLNVQRLEAIAREAAEQCERLSVPAIAPILPLNDFVADRAGRARLIFCDEAGDDPAEAWGGPTGRAPPMRDALSVPVVPDVSVVPVSPVSPVSRVADERLSALTAHTDVILIGPEGGFTPDERGALRAAPDTLPVSLGPRILRADTAAIAALALWQASLGDWRAP